MPLSLLVLVKLFLVKLLLLKVILLCLFLLLLDKHLLLLDLANLILSQLFGIQVHLKDLNFNSLVFEIVHSVALGLVIVLTLMVVNAGAVSDLLLDLVVGLQLHFLYPLVNFNQVVLGRLRVLDAQGMHEIFPGLSQPLSVVCGRTSPLDALQMVGIDRQSHVCVLEGELVLLLLQLALGSVAENDGPQVVVGVRDVR